MSIFWSWYGLSLHDINMGTTFFSRDLHDQVFEIYSQILQIPAEDIPGMAAKACVIDTFIVFGILALRHYRKWGPGLVQWVRYQSIAVFSGPNR